MKRTVSDRFEQMRREMWRPSAAAAQQNSCWYAGMVIDPTDFSDQLTRLQSSLHRANAPVPADLQAQAAVVRQL